MEVPEAVGLASRLTPAFPPVRFPLTAMETGAVTEMPAPPPASTAWLKMTVSIPVEERPSGRLKGVVPENVIFWLERLPESWITIRSTPLKGAGVEANEPVSWINDPSKDADT